MITEEERAAILDKVKEIHIAITKSDENLKSIPFRSETETMRMAMEQLTQQLHRMEDNLRDLLGMKASDEAISQANDAAVIDSKEE